MTSVSGFLHTVTKDPSRVISVWVKAERLRLSTNGLTTPEQEKVEWDPDTGAISFTAEPGKAVLVLQYLTRSESVPMGIPDLTAATLDQVVGHDYQYPPPVLNLVEQYRNEVIEAAGVIGSAERVLEAESTAVQAAERAEAAAQSTRIIEAPEGSGLWTISSTTMAVVESPASSGLYEIGVI